MPIRKEEGKAKKLLFSIVIGFVLVSSVIGFTFSAIPFGLQPQSTSLKYSGYEFFPTQTGFGTIIDNQIFEFTNLPGDVENLDIGIILSKLSNSPMVYATSDPNSSLASAISGVEFTVSRILEKDSNTFLEVAFTAGNPYGKRIITCEDATPFIPVLLFNFTNTTTNIIEQNNCVIINVESELALNRIRDKIAYELLDIEP